MKITNIFMFIFATILLTACSNQRGGLLSVRSIPNEFEAYKHAPLEVPEASATLPKPQVGAKPLLEVTPEEQAQNALR